MELGSGAKVFLRGIHGVKSVLSRRHGVWMRCGVLPRLYQREWEEEGSGMGRGLGGL